MTRLRKRLTGVMIREVDEEVLLLDTESDQIHQLNQTASFIWRNCSEATSAEEIAARLTMEFDVGKDAALKDVIEVLGRLQALELIIEVQ